MALWLNATGAKADRVEEILRRRGLPLHRGRPVPLEHLPRLLVTPDAHLITLRDGVRGLRPPLQGLRLRPSGRDVLYVGSPGSDVHLLASRGLAGGGYLQVDTGDAAGVAQALETIADRAQS